MCYYRPLKRLSIMPIRFRIGMLLGRQYVFIRTSSWLAFRIKRAYKIRGRWYFIDSNNMYAMLTNENRITDFNAPEVNDGSLVQGVWFPITKLIDAWMTMQGE